MKELIEDRIKALVGSVVSGITGYVALAIINHTALTLQGLEVAAASAVTTFLGIHEAPQNTDRAHRQQPRKAAKRKAR